MENNTNLWCDLSGQCFCLYMDETFQAMDPCSQIGGETLDIHNFSKNYELRKQLPLMLESINRYGQ